jgi:hypothetical protein
VPVEELHYFFTLLLGIRITLDAIRYFAVILYMT